MDTYYDFPFFITIFAWTYRNPPGWAYNWFDGWLEIENCTDFETGNCNNVIVIEDCGTTDPIGYGGIVKWCKFWNPEGCP